jgi:hypothetical protein
MPGPHDLFVRFTFGHPEQAAAELRAVLPPEISAQVDWSTLRQEPNSVVDPELRETESDLFFSARLREGRTLLFYVLLEHQSSVDRWMALRMLRYVVRQLEHWRQEHPGSARLPVIIPLVLYHGSEGAWSAPRRVEELFEVPEEEAQSAYWRTLVPRFEHLVDDVTAEREEALTARSGPPLARLTWLILRYGRSEDLAQRLPGWTLLFAQIHAAPGGAEQLRGVFHYLLLIGNKAARAATAGVLHSLVNTQRAEELMLTREEFIEQLRLRGRIEERAESVLRILAKRGVHVDAKSRQRILLCEDMVLLDQWFDRALQATRLSDVLEGLTQ